MLKAIAVRFSVVALLSLISISAFALADEAKRAVSIPAGDLSVALDLLARQSGNELMYRPEQVRGFHTQGAQGDLTAREAVMLLLKGTPLQVRAEASGALLVVAPANAATSQQATSEQQQEQSKEGAGKKPSQEFRVAQVDQTPSGSLAEKKREQQKEVLDEVVVTGTHIHGVASTASPVQVFSRDDIDRTGLATVKDFMQSIPQNFNGVANEGTNGVIAGGSAAGQNLSGGSAINLRGLGPDATLVLIDGHRMAPGNVSGNWSDISLIPLAAVERIEVLLDGASAIYGSDAVGGVVNLVMRKSFNGAETRARYGFSSDGGDREIQVGQTLGHIWDTGSAVLTYEYFDRTGLLASDRSFTQTSAEPTTLLPQQLRNSAFLSLQQALSPTITLFAEGSFGRRTGTQAIASPFGFAESYDPTVTSSSGTLGARAALPHDTDLVLSSSYARTDTRVDYVTNNVVGNPDRTATSTGSVDLNVDGPLWTLPAGPIRYAAGGQVRRETFDTNGPSTSQQGFDLSRNVYAGFLEINVPIFGPRSGATTNQLELNLAARAEHFSDFGSSTNPKVGLAWQALKGLKIRSTFGTSFNAPTLSDLNPIPYHVFIQPEFDPVSQGQANTLIAAGGNPNLTPQKADTWTLGLDWKPESLPRFSANATYYVIRFTDRITTADQAGYNIFNALNQPVLAPIVQRNPPLSLLQSLIASAAQFSDYSGIPGGAPLSSIVAFIDDRQLNLSSLHTSGVDFHIAYIADTSVVKLETGVDGTYIFKYDERLVPDSPIVSVLNTPYNPIDLKLRGRVILSRGNWSFGSFLNFVKAYQDNRTNVVVPVSSFTTADVILGYELPQAALRDTAFSLSVINVTNKSPPYVVGSQSAFVPGINYDATNANALGRVISLQLTKSF